MEQVTQQRAPLLEAMQAHRLNRVVRFDVPGHKGGYSPVFPVLSLHNRHQKC